MLEITPARNGSTQSTPATRRRSREQDLLVEETPTSEFPSPGSLKFVSPVVLAAEARQRVAHSEIAASGG
jgi:hypothetical protein